MDGYVLVFRVKKVEDLFCSSLFISINFQIVSGKTMAQFIYRITYLEPHTQKKKTELTPRGSGVKIVFQKRLFPPKVYSNARFVHTIGNEPCARTKHVETSYERSSTTAADWAQCVFLRVVRCRRTRTSSLRILLLLLWWQRPCINIVLCAHRAAAMVAGTSVFHF